jgi:hypothetical protein
VCGPPDREGVALDSGVNPVRVSEFRGERTGYCDLEHWVGIGVFVVKEPGHAVLCTLQQSPKPLG